MKRIIVAFLLILNIGIAYGASDKTITSKTYVDNQLATKQDKIRAIDDKTVITHTGSAGEIGEKGIYDSNGDFVSQYSSLVTAGDANTGINNALENEFVCVDEDTDSTCLLWKVKNQTEYASGKNLLNDSFMDNSTYSMVTAHGVNTNYAKILPTENGKTYTLSATLIGHGAYYYYLKGVLPDGTLVSSFGGTCDKWLWNTNGSLQQYASTTRNVSCRFTATDDAIYMVYFAGASYVPNLTITNYQMEEGNIATEYEPYKNLYLPQNQ